MKTGIIFWLFSCMLFHIIDVASAEGKVYLEKLSTVYLPRRFNDDGTGLQFEFDSSSAEQFAYDKSRRLAYVAGSDNIYVVSNNNPNNLELLHAQSLRDDEIFFIDIEFCGGFVIAAYYNLNNFNDAKLQIYREYNSMTDTLELVQEITLPARVDQAVPTSDCKKIVVSIEANRIVDENGTVIEDPPGEILILKVPMGGDLADDLTMLRLDFTAWDDRLDELKQQGFVQNFFGPDGNNKLSNDIEPEFIAFDKNEKFAYVTLQENNGMAVVDLLKHEIVRVFGLGLKKFNDVKLDPSDRDGGINLAPRPQIHGLRTPDAVRVSHIMGEDVLITANEGDTVFGIARLQDVVLDPAVFPDRDELQREENLGRLMVDSINGDTNNDGLIDKILVPGDRGFTIFNAWDGSVIFDSEDLIATNFASRRPDIFNAGPGQDTLRLSFDSRSDDRGLEPEHVFVQKVDDHMLIFVGLERPGCIMTFVVDITKLPTKATFEDLFCNIPNRPDATWPELYDERVLSEIDVEEFRIVLPGDSPTGELLLLALGTRSGTLSSFSINFRGDKASTTPTTASPTSRTTSTRRPTTRKPRRRIPKRKFKGRRRIGKKGCFKRRKSMRRRKGFRRMRKSFSRRHW